MKEAQNQFHVDVFPYVITRTAGLPLSVFEQLKEGEVQDEGTWNTAMQRGFSEVFGYTQNEVLLRSLLFSSHDFLDALLSLPPTTPEKGWNKKQRKTLFALLRYLCRAAGKTSPFSRLTTVACHRIDNLDLTLPFFAEKTAVTPNVVLLSLLYEGLLRVPAFYRNLPVRMGAVWLSGDQYRWLDVYEGQEEWKEADVQGALQLIIAHLDGNGGKVLFQSLVAQLSKKIETTPEELEPFLLDLLHNGFLQWVLPEYGLSASWAGKLYQHLGFFPDHPMFTEVLILLQQMRNTGRTLAYQTLDEAKSNLGILSAEVDRVLTKPGGQDPAIPSNALFYEDVDGGKGPAIPKEELIRLSENLHAQWLGLEKIELPRSRAQLLHVLNPDEAVKLDALYDRLKLEQSEEVPLGYTDVWKGPMGALLQPYREDGSWKAVVNGMFPGGGKLMARWMHLFPGDVTEALKDWQPAGTFAYPWQGWSNANLQPVLHDHLLEVPHGRVRSSGKGEKVALSSLLVERRGNDLVLCTTPGGPAIQLVDLGLEDYRSRPYMQRLLYLLGTPPVSVTALWTDNEWRPIADYVLYQPRLGKAGLVLRRSRWLIKNLMTRKWVSQKNFDFYQAIRDDFSAMGIPSRSYYRLGAEKPQYLDLDSPVLVELFRRRWQQRSALDLMVEELLPGPDQVPGGFAHEVVVEMKPKP